MTPVGASESPPTSRLRARVEALCELSRESASDGERASADWISAELGRLGLRARIEEERATGGYWRALGLLSALSLGGALAALRGRRIVGTVVGLLAAAAIYDDLDLHGRVVRRALAWRRTHNVICELGELSAPHTAVLLAHHDAAHSGLIFHPKPSELMIRYAPKLVARANSDPPIWAPVIAAPGLTALGAATGWRPASRAGVLLAAIVTAVLGDVARRDPVPGAIDNASGVAALIELAGHLKAHPPTNLRVLLVWTGAEEALWEGMEGFARRHFRNLRPDSTFILNVDQVGDPVFTVLRGEGALRIRE